MPESRHAPSDSRDSLRSNLPAVTTPLVGRSKEIAASLQFIDSGVRLLTLTGAGGIGKTRVALEVACRCSDGFPGGVVFVGLAPLSDPALVASAIAHAVGASDTGQDHPRDSIKEAIGDRCVLLVLDNFEHVLAAAPLVGDLLATCPNLAVLATSRASLRLSGEQEFPLPPLSLPPTRWAPGRPLPKTDVLAGYEAVALFVQRAQAAKPDFALAPEHALTVAEICARLDGLPLAIELAAPWIKVLPPPVLLARLSRRLALLTGGARDLPVRQQTLRNTIDWSFALLTPDEQELFVRLAVFAGGWTLGAMEALCGENALSGLAALLEKSLVRQQNGRDGENRFTMLETVREYAIERLQSSGQAQEMARRHADYFLELALQAEPELRGPQQAAWLDRLEADHDNIRAALDWLARHSAAEDPLRMAGGLWRFWQMRGYAGEGTRRLTQLLSQPKPEQPTRGYQAARAEALFGSAVLSVITSGRLAMRAPVYEALELWREIGDESGVAYALYGLGETDLFDGDCASARVHLEQSAAEFRRIDDRLGLAWSLNSLGYLHSDEGRQAEAQAALDEALAIFQATGEERGTAIVLVGRGSLAETLGDNAAAWSYYRQSISLQQALGDHADFPWVLEACASLAAAQGNLTLAARLAGAAFTLRESHSNLWRISSFAARYERRLAQARQTLGETAFAEAWASGSEMSLEEALALALDPEAQNADDVAGTRIQPAKQNGSTPMTVPWRPLTERERDVALLVAQGLSNRQIAEQLTITRNTAGVHVVHILNKLGLHSRAQIAAWAVARGLSTSGSEVA